MTTDAPGAHPVPDERRERIARLERKIESLHRSVIEKDVLRRQLPLRAPILAHRSAQADARERERRFQECSPAYARALADTSADPRIHATTIDSLPWSVPVLKPDDPAFVARAMGHQDFPYRVITQTREVGLGGVMLDIGANTGRMSISRVMLGDVAAVYCAEADSLNYRCLVRNVRDNHLGGIVMPDQLAIGSDDGVVRLEQAKTAGGHRVIDAGVEPTGAIVEVPSLTLDTWLGRLDVDPRDVTFVKVDVQGSEVHVLRGAGRLLACPHVAWQMEVDVEWLGRRGSSLAALFELLSRHFTHFVDLNRASVGERVRRTSDFGEALAHLDAGTPGRTDLLLYNLATVQPQ